MGKKAEELLASLDHVDNGQAELTMKGLSLEDKLILGRMQLIYIFSGGHQNLPLAHLGSSVRKNSLELVKGVVHVFPALPLGNLVRVLQLWLAVVKIFHGGRFAAVRD